MFHIARFVMTASLVIFSTLTLAISSNNIHYIAKFIDPYHVTVVLVQWDFGIVFNIKSSVRAVMADRKAVQKIFSGV